MINLYSNSNHHHHHRHHHHHHHHLHRHNNINKKQNKMYPTTIYNITRPNKTTTTILLLSIIVVLCAITEQPKFVLGDGYLLSSLLQKMKVSPDIIRVPNYLNQINVELNGLNVKPGDPVPAKNFKFLDMGKINWNVNNEDARHTVILLDLDRKPNGTQANMYNQFTSINIPGHIIFAGQSIVSFEPPAVPCNPSLKHRILMLAFHQEQNIDIKDVSDIAASTGHSQTRENFKLNEFIKNHRLNLVAANIFQAIGETNGLCSGSSSLILSSNNISQSILMGMSIAMVIAFWINSFKSSIYRTTALKSIH